MYIPSGRMMRPGCVLQANIKVEPSNLYSQVSDELVKELKGTSIRRTLLVIINTVLRDSIDVTVHRGKACRFVPATWGLGRRSLKASGCTQMCPSLSTVIYRSLLGLLGRLCPHSASDHRLTLWPSFQRHCIRSIAMRTTSIIWGYGTPALAWTWKT